MSGTFMLITHGWVVISFVHGLLVLNNIPDRRVPDVPYIISTFSPSVEVKWIYVWNIYATLDCKESMDG